MCFHSIFPKKKHIGIKRISFILIFNCFLYSLEGQINQYEIDTIDIKSDLFYHSDHLGQINYDSSSLRNANKQSIDHFLSKQSLAFIKTYGAGSSSTISLRGGAATQTQIQWNDIPINNPMLGLNDLSLIPLNSFENITIVAGGQSATNGSGAVTGFINLKDDIKLNRGFKLNSNFNIGSFKKRSFASNFSYSNKKFGINVGTDLLSAENNFTYPINGVQKTQSHANIENKTLKINSRYWLSPNASLNAAVWFQKTFRQIPPTTTQNRSFSDQEDHINRYAISYLLNKGNWQFKSNMSLLDEENIFNDSLNLIHSNNQFVSIINKTNLEYNWRSDVDFHIGFMINNTTVNSKFYQEKITGTNLSTFFKFIHRTRNGFLSLAVNKAWDSHSDSPLTPQLNYIIDLSNENKIAFKVSHEYRLPTFNERFWTPGGDQELESEKGWNQEISFSSESDRYTFETVLFHRTINNWILWAIPENQFFYSATNLAKVQSYGIESKINLNWEFGQSKHILQSGYSYNISKNLENVSNPNIKKGDQIFYTPKHKLILNYHMKYRSWQFDWQSSFVSSTIGILDQLPSYFIADLSIQKSIAIDDIQTRFQLSVNNIFNKNYRIIERRPMPGINYEFKIAFQL